MFFIEAATSSITPARAAARKHSSVNASMPLIMTLRTILIAAAAPISAPATLTRMPSAASCRRDRLGMRAGEQHRRLMPRRIDRRQHGDVDIARGVAEELCGLLLAAGRNRIDVEEIRLAGEMRLDRLRRFDAGRGGDGGDDHVRPAHGVGGRTGAAHADRFGGAAGAFRLRACGNRISHADIFSTPASRSPAAMAWPASPKPMNAMAGFPFGMAIIPSSVARADDGRFGARICNGAGSHTMRCPIGCAKKHSGRGPS